MAAKPTPKPTVGTTRISPMGTQTRDAQAAARAKAYQDRNDPSKMTPAQKAAYLANPGRSAY